MNSQRQQHAGSITANDSVISGATTNITSSPVDSAHPGQQATFQDSNSYNAPVAPQNQSPYATAGDQQHYPDPSQQTQQLPSLQSVQHGVAPGGDSQLAATGSYNVYQNTFTNAQDMSSQSSSDGRRYSMDNKFSRPGPMTNRYTQPLPMHPPPVPGQQISSAMYTQQAYQAPGPATHGQQYQTNLAKTPLPPLPPFGMPPPANAMSPSSVQSGYAYQMSGAGPSNMVPEYDIMGQFMGSYNAMPVFGTDGFNRSPQAIDDMLFANLMESSGMAFDVPPSPPDVPYGTQMPGAHLPKVEGNDAALNQYSATTHVDDTSPKIYAMDLSMRECSLSEKKQNRLIAMTRSWEDIERMPGRKMKEEFMSGDITDPKHPLSMDMLKTYLTSFWIHIHQQMPIMHRPSFNADTCPDLLLMAMMCLGACCLDRTHTTEHIRICAELSFFCAYHIRWEVFKDAEFRPTAKLWTFQTMLLLELFEKMYSTRVLHERAHVHHATTLTVMRRGSSLIGRGANDEALSDPTRTPPGPDGSINTSGQNTPDAWWNRWITAEATRRVAYAAFVIDSTHATLFGHSAIMSPHDLRLPLPCDEALWAAESGAEVQRAEQSLAANGFRGTTFLEGLKKTLNGQKVRTNVFGRVILMAGLLNVTWHMNNRDLQVTAISAQSSMGNPTRWRTNLTHAFDFWRRDFDEALVKPEPAEQTSNKSTCHKDHRDNVFESRTCLHSLAHMAMHVDIVDCEMFAGSKRALGRVVIESDRVGAQKRMREWAQSARARDAVYYASRFLIEVLMPGMNPAKLEEQTPHVITFAYSARDDYLLNRPYILYYACMIVWAYGYALDGPVVAPNYSLVSPEAQVWDMQQYLTRIGRIAGPDDLMQMKDRNHIVGLLILMRDCFEKPRWELLHESSIMLGSCMELLWPGINQELEQYKNQQEKNLRHQYA